MGFLRESPNGSRAWQKHAFSVEPSEEYVAKALAKLARRAAELDLRNRLYLRAKGKCLYCGCRMWRYKLGRVHGEFMMTLDHFTPRSQGGANTIGNYVAACRACNAKKSALPPEMFLDPSLIRRIPLRLSHVSATARAEVLTPPVQAES